MVHVFDVSQTEGEELAQPPQISGSPGQYLDRLRAYIGQQGMRLEYDQIPGGARGLSTGGTNIARPDLSEAEEFAVLVHELAHELLHKDEQRRAETDKTIRETEAEAVAYVIQAVGRAGLLHPLQRLHPALPRQLYNPQAVP